MLKTMIGRGELMSYKAPRSSLERKLMEMSRYRLEIVDCTAGRDPTFKKERGREGEVMRSSTQSRLSNESGEVEGTKEKRE